MRFGNNTFECSPNNFLLFFFFPHYKQGDGWILLLFHISGLLGVNGQSNQMQIQIQKNEMQIQIQIQISVACWDKFSLGPICEAATGPDSSPLSFEYIPLFIPTPFTEMQKSSTVSHIHSESFPNIS